MELPANGSIVGLVCGRTENQETLVIDADEAPFPEEGFRELHIDVANIYHVQKILGDGWTSRSVMLDALVDSRWMVLM